MNQPLIITIVLERMFSMDVVIERACGMDVHNDNITFPSAAHMCFWAGLVPGHNESAGKRKSAKTKKEISI